MEGLSPSTIERRKRRLAFRHRKGEDVKFTPYNKKASRTNEAEAKCPTQTELPPVASLPAGGWTLPTTFFGFSLGTLSAPSSQEEVPMEVVEQTVDEFPPERSEHALLISSEEDASVQQQQNLEESHPESNVRYMIGNEFVELPEITDPTGGGLSNDAPHVSQSQENVSTEAVNTEDSQWHNPRGGVDLAKKLMNHPKDLSFRLWSLHGKHRFTNQAMVDIMAALRRMEHICEAKTLPKTTKALQNQHHLFDMDYQYGQRCSKCRAYKVWKYSRDSRNAVNKQRKCCGKELNNYDEHFILMNPAQVFGLALPSLLSKRKYEYLGPEEKEKYEELGLNFDDGDFSVTLNYDGVAVFKGSSRSLWPILATIDGLPVVEKKRNVLLLGAYFGQKKEDPHESDRVDEPTEENSREGSDKSFTDFMFQLHLKSLEQLRENGLVWFDPHTNTERRSRCFVTKVSCDSMGRPALMGLMNLHGTFGCPACYWDDSRKGRYTYREILELRTNHEHRQVLSSEEFVPNKPLDFRGIKYPSPFVKLPYFDLIMGFPPDALHCVYLGVAKHLTQRWLDPLKRPGKKTIAAVLNKSLRRKVKNRFAKLKPPHRVSRISVSLEESSQWKAHQWQMWLLYYSVPLLNGILPAELLSHWEHLVFAIATLSQTCVTERDISVASDNLETFCSDLTKVYPEYPKDYPFNYHLIRHLPAFVKLYGPLYNFSMDAFETFNSVLTGYVKGPLGVALQVAKGCGRRLITAFVESCPDENDTADDSPSPLLRMPLNKWVPPEGFEELLSTSDSNKQFFRTLNLMTTGERITSRAYTTLGMKRSADAALLHNGNVAIVEIFIKTSNQNVYAVATEYMLAEVSSMQHIYKVKEWSLTRRLIPVDEIMGAMLEVKSEDNSTFYVRFLTGAENVRS